MAKLTYEIDAKAMSSLPGMFFVQARKFGDRPFLWEKVDGVYRALSWTQVADRISARAPGLKTAGVKPGDRVLLVSENRPEWLIADVAIMSVGAIAVPAYTANTAVNHLHILNDAGTRVALVSTAQLARHVIAAAAEADTKLTVYVYEDPDKAMRSEVEIRPWSELTGHGHIAPPTPMHWTEHNNPLKNRFSEGTLGEADLRN